MLRSLLAAFRQHYPQGSLVSDLAQIYDGLYVVRAAVIVEDRTLATGLAAHSNLETAEDRAYERALRHLGTVALETSTVTHLNGLAVPPATPSPIVAAAPVVEPKTLATAPVTVSAQPSPPAIDLDLDHLAIEEPMLNFAPEAAPMDLPREPVEPAVEPIVDLPLSHDLLHLESLPTPSIDLSDIIAQTDVELQRLGWNVAQGREFLEKTYGKRSRHELTDEELLEFLLFLETQPTPSP